MFTGLIESVGVVAETAAAESGVRLRVATPLARELHLGDSMAVNGVCLTVAAVSGDAIDADIGPETVRVTTLGAAKAGDHVNLERAMRADSRFGGHFVQGHADATGSVRAVRPDGDAHWLTIAFPVHLAPYLIPKGSIAVDGVSLTIAALRDDEIDVMLIPFTWEHTNLHHRQTGDRVNLECDLVGKYVARAAELALGSTTGHGGTGVRREK
jgi:riboflavin synthase alpha subunit